jgi:hypothetical protein
LADEDCATAGAVHVQQADAIANHANRRRKPCSETPMRKRAFGTTKPSCIANPFERFVTNLTSADANTADLGDGEINNARSGKTQPRPSIAPSWLIGACPCDRP